MFWDPGNIDERHACLCYQCDNRWYVEGTHQAHLARWFDKRYDTNAILWFCGVQSIVEIDPRWQTKNFTIIPPYNEIIDHVHKKKITY
jgi:hypothetical protein